MNIFKNECLNDIVIIDGMARSGKFYLGKLISGIKDMEYFISSANIDTILALNIAGTLNDADATSLLVNSMNEEIYHLAIGRDLNMRHDDGSSILNSFEKGLYIDRQNKGLDGYDGLKKITDNRLSVFILHQSLQLLGIVKGAAPKSKIINIRRHPIDLAYSWIKRGWGHRYGKDPLSFQPVYMHNGNPVPYFAVEWADEYIDSDEYDRVIKSIVYLTEKESHVINSQQSDICCIFYENLVKQADKEMGKIYDFLGRYPHESMDKIINRETRDIAFQEQRSMKIDYISSGADDKFSFDRLLDLGIVYDKNLNNEDV